MTIKGKITVVLESQRIEPRAPLYWRMIQAKRNPPVTFQGRVI